MIDLNTDIENTEESSTVAQPEMSKMEKTIKLIRPCKADSKDNLDDPASEIDERSDFEKSLYPKDEKIVDFKNYHFGSIFFDALNKEVKVGIEPKYADYKESLLNLLQHCYGFYYNLITTDDKKVRKAEVEYINFMIAGENKTSNVNNSLHAKIIKLAWKGTNIGTKRISTYANLLSNAFTKGELVNGITDKNGSILPEHFLKAVTENGGINAFSRISAKSIEARQALKDEGFDSQGEKALSIVKDAIELGEFIGAAENSKPIPIQSIDLPAEFSKLTDGDFGVVLVKYNSSATDSIEPIYASTDIDKIETMLRKFYSKLEEESKPVVVKPVILKYKKKDLRGIETAVEILDVNGGDVDAFLDAIHVDKEKFNHLRLQPA